MQGGPTGSSPKPRRKTRSTGQNGRYTLSIRRSSSCGGSKEGVEQRARSLCGWPIRKKGGVLLFNAIRDNLTNVHVQSSGERNTFSAIVGAEGRRHACLLGRTRANEAAAIRVTDRLLEGELSGRRRTCGDLRLVRDCHSHKLYSIRVC